MSSIHVIIVTYNGMKWIEKCLKSVALSDMSVKIILIDNKSTDGTADFVKKEFPEVQLIVADDNLGFGRANNLGMSLAIKDNTDGVFLLNQDAYVESKTISYLYNLAKNDLNLGIISPLHMNGDGSAVDIGFSNYLKRGVRFEKKKADNEIPLLSVPFINAAAWYIPKNTLLTVGGFDPLFKHYGEDADYCNRVVYHRLKILVCNEVKIFHDRPQVQSKDASKNKAKYKHGTFVNYLALAKKPGDSMPKSILKVFLYSSFNCINEVKNAHFELSLIHVQHFLSIVKMHNELKENKALTKKEDSVFIN